MRYLTLLLLPLLIGASSVTVVRTLDGSLWEMPNEAEINQCLRDVLHHKDQTPVSKDEFATCASFRTHRLERIPISALWSNAKIIPVNR